MPPPDPANNRDNQPAAAQQGSDPQPEPWSIRKLWPDWPAAHQRALGIDGRIRQNRQELGDRQDIISMEFLKSGDLGKWIGKV